jgi:hypothetical protein
VKAAADRWPRSSAPPRPCGERFAEMARGLLHENA